MRVSIHREPCPKQVSRVLGATGGSADLTTLMKSKIARRVYTIVKRLRGRTRRSSSNLFHHLRNVSGRVDPEFAWQILDAFPLKRSLRDRHGWVYGSIPRASKTGVRELPMSS